MKYVVLFCWFISLAGCGIGLWLGNDTTPPGLGDKLIFGGMTWFFLGVFLGVAGKVVRWMFRS